MVAFHLDRGRGEQFAGLEVLILYSGRRTYSIINVSIWDLLIPELVGTS